MLRLFILFLATFCLLPPVWSGAEEAEAPSVDFIYVNANTGEAAGGHAAIRLGSTVFHFQFFPDDRFLLVRDSWSHFRFVYNDLRNRSIFLVRLPVLPKVYTKIKTHFTELLMEQQQYLARLEERKNQLAMATRLLAGEHRVELSTVGLFTRESERDPAVADLKAALLNRLGSTSFVALQGQVEDRLVHVGGTLQSVVDGFSWGKQFANLLLEREFYRILENGAALAADAVVALPTPEQELTRAEKSKLALYQQSLIASIAGLLQSRRPDRARALLLQTARYLVIGRSLATGRLLTLDPFSSRDESIQVESGSDLQGMYSHLQQDTARTRMEFFSEPFYPDIAYAILETSRGRLHEVEGALLHGRPVRVAQGIRLPDRSGEVSLQGLVKDRSRLTVMLSGSEATLAQIEKEVNRRYGYDLFYRNCATELLRCLLAAFENEASVRRELGGWLDPDSGPLYIPREYFVQVGNHFPVTETEVFPSRRLRELEALYVHGNMFSHWLRESNALTTTLYTPRGEDTPFLFFTDDVLLLRPLFGLANICWGTAHSMTGLLILPVDGGERFLQGLRSLFYSLPELAFSNIRKGTYGFAPTTGVSP